MSRRASLLLKERKDSAGAGGDEGEPGARKARVRFPDELVFLDDIKENDVPAVDRMLRRTSVKIDINAIGTSGMTPLHQACVDGNLQAVILLVSHGADINKRDDDTWTALHAACAAGHADIARFLIQKGADKTILNEDGERPIDLVDPGDLQTVAVMLSN